eukprot:11649014-Ditylum_brightwellii.AAC.1
MGIVIIKNERFSIGIEVGRLDEAVCIEDIWAWSHVVVLFHFMFVLKVVGIVGLIVLKNSIPVFLIDITKKYWEG